MTFGLIDLPHASATRSVPLGQSALVITTPRRTAVPRRRFPRRRWPRARRRTARLAGGVERVLQHGLTGLAQQQLVRQAGRPPAGGDDRVAILLGPAASCHGAILPWILAFRGTSDQCPLIAEFSIAAPRQSVSLASRLVACFSPTRQGRQMPWSQSHIPLAERPYNR